MTLVIPFRTIALLATICLSEVCSSLEVSNNTRQENRLYAPEKILKARKPGRRCQTMLSDFDSPKCQTTTSNNNVCIFGSDSGNGGRGCQECCQKNFGRNGHCTRFTCWCERAGDYFKRPSANTNRP